jgi:hypothetical protein
VVRTPCGSIFEMRDVKPPLYGPTSDTWVHSADVVVRLPPRPPSATYRSPSGPNASPRGLFNPDANTVTLTDNGAATTAIAGEAANGTAAPSNADSPARRAPRDSHVMDQLGEYIAIAPFLAQSLKV